MTSRTARGSAPLVRDAAGAATRDSAAAGSRSAAHVAIAATDPMKPRRLSPAVADAPRLLPASRFMSARVTGSVPSPEAPTPHVAGANREVGTQEVHVARRKA